MKKLFATEVDLCKAFISWAEAAGATCYAECGGWDILIVLQDGFQIGVQAKLSLNDAVIMQALPSQFHNYEWPAPDFRAVLVPEVNRTKAWIAHNLGLVVFDVFAKPMGQHDRFTFLPNLLSQKGWHDWNPERRHEIPETPTDSIAGSPSPVTLTPWKLSALSVLAEIEVNGRIHSRRISELGCHPSRWTSLRWLAPSGDRGFWVKTDKCPPFDKQHPSAFTMALTKAKKAK